MAGEPEVENSMARVSERMLQILPKHPIAQQKA
jgi:hypothetical protein